MLCTIPAIEEDLAHTKTAIQSSSKSHGAAGKAVDGLMSTHSHTELEYQPYWSLDLEKSAYIHRLHITIYQSTGELFLQHIWAWKRPNFANNMWLFWYVIRYIYVNECRKKEIYVYIYIHKPNRENVFYSLFAFRLIAPFEIPCCNFVNWWNHD